MSKAVLSRIKPLNPPKPLRQSLQCFPIDPHIKQLLNDVSAILRTHHNDEQWEENLETRFSQNEGVLVSDVAPLVLDRIRNDFELGLKFFDWVSRRPWSPDSQAYSSLLKVLAQSTRFTEIETVLENMRIEEKQPSNEAFDVLIGVYSDSGLVDRALEFYSRLVNTYSSFPSVFACNALLNALTKYGRIHVAFQLYEEMLRRNDDENTCADNYTTCIMVRGLCREGKVEEGRKLIEDRWGEGCIPNIVFYNTLIDGYCKKGEVERAYTLFCEMKLKGVLPTLLTYGALINGYCKEGNFEVIYKLLSEMKVRGISPNVQIHNNLIDAKCKHHYVFEAVEILKGMVGRGCEPDLVTHNILIYGLCREGRVCDANNIFGQALKRGFTPNKFSYTPLIQGYCRKQEFVKASNLLIRMMETGHEPDLVTYAALVHGLVGAGELDLALAIRDNMIKRRVCPDAGIYNILLSGLCKKGKFPTAKQLLLEMIGQNILPDAYVYATMVDAFVRHGDDISEAKQLFTLVVEKGIEPGLVGYNVMIKGYCKFGMMKDAISCMDEMLKRHIHPDEFTYSTVIDGHIKENDMDGALRVFSNMAKRNCKPNVVTYSSLINGFCRKGDSHRAQELFKEMKSHGLVPNVVTYSILIGNFCRGGKLAEAALLYEEMLNNRCLPNDVTYHYLINGLTNNIPNLVSIEGNGLQENGRFLILDAFRTMMLDKWDPRIAAQNSILVCLCQHKMLNAAFQFRDKMIGKGYLPDSVSFAALLHGICVEGRSREWKNFFSCNLDQYDVKLSLRYSVLFDQQIHNGNDSEASIILRSLLDEGRSHDPTLSDREVNII